MRNLKTGSLRVAGSLGCVGALLVGGVTVATGEAATGEAATLGSNLVANPGCESGTTGYWTYNSKVSASRIVSHSGKYSCQVTSTAGGVYSLGTNSTYAKPQSGQYFEATAWVRSARNRGEKIYAAMRASGGAAAATTIYGTAVTLTTTWQKVSVGTTNQDSDRTSIEFYLAQDPGTRGDVFFADDLSFAAGTSTPPPPTTTTKPAAPPLFADEFEGSALNTNVWSRCYPWADETVGCSNNPSLELEWYQPSNVSVAGGNLQLNAKKESVKAGYPYTSGIVTTGGRSGSKSPSFAFTYGFVEVRAKMPSGAGMWPAFWLLPTDYSWPPEIDVVEFQGAQPSVDFVNLHYQTSAGASAQSGVGYAAGTDLSADFHTYAVDWQADHLSFYLDGKEVKRITDTAAIPSKPMYILLNLAVGGWVSGQMNPDQSKFPATFLVDYVRAYRSKP